MSTTPVEFQQILIIPLQENPFIQEDIFVNHRVTDTIELSGHSHFPEQVRLEIHSEAFRSSRNFTKQVKIYSCDLEMLNFAFLTDFCQLTDLLIKNSINVRMSNFPQLPSLMNLQIIQCTGLNGWIEFPRSISSLEYINLQGNGLNDERMYAILEWILKSPSSDTLNRLDISFNKLTRIPIQLKSFAMLTRIYLNNQQNPGFGFVKLTLSLTAPLAFLDLSSCNITGFHPDSFKGSTL